MLGELRRSGLSVGAFARRHEVDQQRLYYWLKRETPEPTSASFVEVKMPTRSAEAVNGERIELELLSGRKLMVAESVDVQALRRIVDALEY